MFDTAFSNRTGIPESEVADHARVRSIATENPDTFLVLAEASYQLDIDWVRVVREIPLQAGDSAPTNPQLVSAWSDWMWPPVLDLDAELMPFEEVQAFLDGCAAQFGVVFDDAGWCNPRYPTEPDEGGMLRLHRH